MIAQFWETVVGSSLAASIINSVEIWESLEIRSKRETNYINVSIYKRNVKQENSDKIITAGTDRSLRQCVFHNFMFCLLENWDDVNFVFWNFPNARIMDWQLSPVTRKCNWHRKNWHLSVNSMTMSDMSRSI
jgi:hypothetical protein